LSLAAVVVLLQNRKAKKPAPPPPSEPQEPSIPKRDPPDCAKECWGLEMIWMIWIGHDSRSRIKCCW
jgi:hypothetical protein